MVHSDNFDGTFTNPLIWSDYPDPDIIRVGGDFYMASSSFTDAPGIPICHSRDLVNWKIIGYVYDCLPESNPAYSMLDGTVAYRGGSWAPSLRYHDGKFHVCFCTPAEGFFMAVSERPEGPYALTAFGTELYDPGLFFDDNGRVFVAHGANTIRITELTSDALAIKTPGKVIYETAFGTPFEGSHLHKRNGWYYLCCTCRGYNGIEVCLRSRNIYGPYEARLISADDMNYEGAGLHQGGFVDLENGETWFFMFQDRDFIGRVPVLLRVTWQDGWPLIGDHVNFWRIPVTQEKPSLPSVPVSLPGGGDEFDEQQLGLQWQWNHNPDDTRWSLSARSGLLRLTSAPAPDLLHARNTLTQKIVGPESHATTLLDFSGMAEGDIAGICIQNIPCAFLGVEIRNAEPLLVMDRNGSECAVEGLSSVGSTIQLRVTVTTNGEALFSWSFDGETFHFIGEPFVMEFTVKTFLGNKFGLFCFNRSGGGGGYADFDWFRLPEAKPSNLFHAGEWIPACRYDAERGVDTHRIEQKRPRQLLIRISDGDWVRFNQIDFGFGSTRLEARVRGPGSGGEIHFYLGDADQKRIGVLQIPAISSADGEQTLACSIISTLGIHPLEMRFFCPFGDLIRFEEFRFL
ncbi:MAG: family 43 glycosylhydrolase [bacterium]